MQKQANADIKCLNICIHIYKYICMHIYYNTIYIYIYIYNVLFMLSETAVEYLLQKLSDI